MSWSSMIGSDLIVNNLTVLGNLTMDTESNNLETITATKIQDSTNTSFILFDASGNNNITLSSSEIILNGNLKVNGTVSTNGENDTLATLSTETLMTNTIKALSGNNQIDMGNSSSGVVSVSADILACSGGIVSNALAMEGVGSDGYITNNANGEGTLYLGNNYNYNLQVHPSSVSTSTQLKVSNTTASTTPTTGALIVDGGVGISGNLNFGGYINNCPFMCPRAWGSNYPYFVNFAPAGSLTTGFSYGCTVSPPFPQYAQVYSVTLTFSPNVTAMGMLNVTGTATVNSVVQSFNSVANSLTWVITLSTNGCINFVIY